MKRKEQGHGKHLINTGYNDEQEEDGDVGWGC